MRGMLFVFLAIAASGCLMHPYSGEAGPANNTSAAAVPPAPAPVQRVCLGPVCGADGETYQTDCEAYDAHIAILYTGECHPVEAACNDTDAGLDRSAAGVVTKGNETHADYCLDAAQLVEYGCLDNTITMSTVQCGTGSACEDGRCVEKNVTNQTARPFCAGLAVPDIYAKQNVTWNGTIYYDLCADYQNVKDYFCQDQKLMSINHNCPAGYGCTDGACIPMVLSCSETDAGNDTTIRGRTTVTRGIGILSEDWDTCVDMQVIREYYCLANGSSSYSEFSCGSGKKCVDGRCVRSLCTQTSAYKDIYTVGTVKVGSDSFTDDCTDTHTVHEFYCYGDDVTSENIGCGSGYACDNGACVKHSGY